MTVRPSLTDDGFIILAKYIDAKNTPSQDKWLFVFCVYDGHSAYMTEVTYMTDVAYMTDITCLHMPNDLKIRSESL